MSAISDAQWHQLLRDEDVRTAPDRERVRAQAPAGALLNSNGTLFLVAADHPARGALRAGADPMAMADRRSLLDRLITALAHPDVDGVLGSPDVVEELLLLGALEGKVVIGSMNRGGLDGAEWTMDDRFTGYDAASIAACRLEGGKMLLRIDDRDAGTVPTLQACAQAVTELARHKLVAMVEPLPYRRDADGTLVLQQDAPLARAGRSRWPRRWARRAPTPGSRCRPATIPDVVYGATTLPCVVLGGVPGPDLAEQVASWGKTLRQPVVRGLVIGRTVLYPDGGDVAGTVDAAAKVLRAATEGTGGFAA